MTTSFEELRRQCRGKVVYLAAAYWHPNKGKRLKRAREASRAALWLIKNEVTVYSPLSHSVGMLTLSRKGNMNVREDFWLEHGLTMLKRCDLLLVLIADDDQSWMKSEGVMTEISKAKEMHIPVLFMDGRGM